MDGAVLARMANQIGANLSAQGEQAAIAGTAEHLRLYWAPAMREALAALDEGQLNAIALAAVRSLRAGPPR